jgi:uncharacterized protein (TIGR00369 family)
MHRGASEKGDGMSTSGTFTPQDAHFEERVRASFARQRAMSSIGAELVRVAPGEVVIRLAHREELTQQHGFLHAGIVTAAVDSACGYAALSLMPADVGVLSVEYKVNFVAPASGEWYLAIGRVLKPGRTLTVCLGEVHAHPATADQGAADQGAADQGVPEPPGRLVATMMATIMTVRGRAGVAD